MSAVDEAGRLVRSTELRVRAVLATLDELVRAGGPTGDVRAQPVDDPKLLAGLKTIRKDLEYLSATLADTRRNAAEWREHARSAREAGREELADQADAQARGEEQVAVQFETEIQATWEFLRALGIDRIDGIENLNSRPSG